MTIYIVSLLSLMLTPATWIALMIHHLLANRPIALACLWSILTSCIIYLAVQLIATYGQSLVDLPVFRTLIDGKLTDRDLDCVSFIMLPIPIVVAIAAMFKPVLKISDVGTA
jgi:hypothetical protein